MNCNAITKQGNKCSKKAIPFSKYCLFHQDPSAWIYGTVLGIIATILIAVWQIRDPEISVRCDTDELGSPDKLICTVNNSGRGEANNIYISFTEFIPTGTEVISDPEIGAKLITVKSPPNPNLYPESSKFNTAFSILIPRVSARDKIRFMVQTLDPDNIRTAKHIMKIKKATEELLNTFGNFLAERHPDDYKKWDIHNVIQNWTKSTNFYRPYKYSSPRGRFDVEFFNQIEIASYSFHSDLYNKYKDEFEPIAPKKEFLISIIKFTTAEGTKTYVKIHPYFNYCTPVFDVTTEMSETGLIYKFDMIGKVPDNYEEGCNHKQ